jgi:hypothetical protein
MEFSREDFLYTQLQLQFNYETHKQKEYQELYLKMQIRDILSRGTRTGYDSWLGRRAII